MGFIVWNLVYCSEFQVTSEMTIFKTILGPHLLFFVLELIFLERNIYMRFDLQVNLAIVIEPRAKAHPVMTKKTSQHRKGHTSTSQSWMILKPVTTCLPMLKTLIPSLKNLSPLMETIIQALRTLDPKLKSLTPDLGHSPTQASETIMLMARRPR